MNENERANVNQTVGIHAPLGRAKTRRRCMERVVQQEMESGRGQQRQSDRETASAEDGRTDGRLH